MRRAILFVRNPFTHDARVLRAAGALRERGYDPLVVAVASTTVRRRAEVQEGVPVLRVDPTSPLAWARGRLRRRGPATATAAPGPAGGGAGDWPRPVVRLHRWMRTLDFYRRGIGILRRERPALVHCNDYNTMWVGMAARTMRGTAVVYDSHELWPDRNLRPEPRWWLLACEAVFVRAAHAVVAASPGYADVMARRYRVRRPYVVRNVPSGPRPAAASPATEPDVAVYAGGLAPHRGLEQAIRALALAPGLRLRLLGPGRPEYVEGLFALAREEGVGDRLARADTVAPGAVVEAVRGAAFGLALFQPVCLSHRLVAPNKVFEYVAAGVPALASALPVMATFLTETGAGIAVPPDDVPAIAEAARTLAGAERNIAFRRAAVAAGRRATWEREREVLDRAYAEAEQAGPGVG
ncbi:MAG TPA: glycosyltransferase [Solirubrobacteraceae bacterium]|nr:glycosyltransferase [Solirubrobacteraceae bacterium]